jgi:hypothetical protein
MESSLQQTSIASINQCRMIISGQRVMLQNASLFGLFSKDLFGSVNIYSIGIVAYCFSRNIIDYTTAVLQHWQLRCNTIDRL